MIYEKNLSYISTLDVTQLHLLMKICNLTITIFSFSGPCDSHQDGDHHHGHQDPERVGGEGQEDQGAHQRRPEEVNMHVIDGMSFLKRVGSKHLLIHT